ncbi:hypothetical protein H6F74_26790 [Trichocoleus sp. FACHB-90]|nr:hypothetical protein [Trichocoleus sp. FACHB-90]MBD1929814.1 hypothetical protein [Trichocoleus sp. FACHB-90]
MEYTVHTIQGLQRLSWLRSQFIFSRLIRLLLKGAIALASRATPQGRSVA